MTRKDDIQLQNARPDNLSGARPAELFPPVEESSELTVACRAVDYSASRLAHAVEDVDAHLLNLNVTSESDFSENRVVASLRVSHRNPEHVARSLERYGYEVLCVDDAPPSDDEESLMRSRYDALMRLLEI